MVPTVMPLHEYVSLYATSRSVLISVGQALISLGNSDVRCKVHMVAGDLYGGEERQVFFLFAEYGKDLRESIVNI